MSQQTPQLDAPYCSNCKYPLTGLTESSKCPECGRPLVEVLTRRNKIMESGKRFRSKAVLFGLPVLDIALGPKDGELKGRARGIVAIGDIATGWLAIGGLARGIVAIGGLALGLCSLGGMSLGVLISAGGMSIGGLSAGGGSIGGISSGGGAVGYVAQGGGAIGYYARGGGAFGVHTVSMAGNASPEAVAVFDDLTWFYGAWPPTSASSLQPFLVACGGTLAAGALIGLIATAARRRETAERWPPNAR